MAIITELVLQRLPDVRHVGTEQRIHTAVWRATTDEALPSDFVIALSQELVGQLPGGTLRLPIKGEALAVDNGLVVPGISPPNVSTWVAAGSGRYADGGAIALDISCQPQQEGYTKSHTIAVTFRAPSPASIGELPGFLTRVFGSSGLTASKLATPPPQKDPDKVSTPELVDALVDTPEFGQARTFHVEYSTIQVGRTEVREVIENAGAAATILGPGPFKNPLNQPYPPIEDVVRTMVVVIEQVVGTLGSFAHHMNHNFNGTINSDLINFEDNIVSPYHARFLGAELSRTRYENGTPYKVLTYRVEISPEAYFERQPATGSYFLAGVGGQFTPVDARKTAFKDDDGYPLMDDFPLTKNGQIAKTAAEQFIHVYTRYKPVPYTFLLDKLSDGF